MGLYEDKRPFISLSEQCWECLDTIKDVGYANTYTFFWSDQLKLIQQVIRKIAPDIKGDWMRFKYEDKTVTFSLSDEAINSYKPKIQEFSSFGSAVRMLGAYEDYIRKIVEIFSGVSLPKCNVLKTIIKTRLLNRPTALLNLE